jgi:hypothetical protein
MLTVTVVGSYRPRLEPTKVLSRAAKVSTTLRLRTLARLYSSDTLLERLASALEHVAAGLGEFI